MASSQSQSAEDFLAGVPPPRSRSAGSKISPAISAEDFLAGTGVGVTPGTSLTSAPAQRSGWTRYPMMAGSELMRGIFAGAGIPGDIESAMGYGDGQTQIPNSPFSIPQLPTSQQMIDWGGKHGLVDRSDLIPGWGEHPQVEHMLASTARGVGAVVPSLPLGGEGAALPILASGGAGGAASELAHQAYPDSTMLPLEAGIIGGGLAGGAATVASRTVNALGGKYNSIGQAFSDAEMPFRSAALTSEHGSTQLATRASVPLAKTESDFISSVSKTADSMGSSITAQDAGKFAQDRAREWLSKTMPAKEAAAWSPVDSAIPKTTPVVIGAFEHSLNDIVTKGGSLAPLEKLLRPALPERLLKALDKHTLNSLGISPTWGDVRQLRSAVGDAMTNPKVSADIGEQNLKRLYASLTDDLRATARNQGAGDLFDRANAESTRLHSFADGPVAKLVSGKRPDAVADPKPEDAANTFIASGTLRRGGSDLAHLNSELPDVTKELASVKIRQIAGIDDPKLVPAKATAQFAKQWESMSPEARTALFRDPAVAKRLDALYTVAKRVSGIKSGKESNRGLQNIAALGTGAAVASILTHLFPDIPVNELTAAAGGGLIGEGVPYVTRGARNLITNNPASAAYAASQAPRWAFPGQTVASAAMGSASNELWPSRQPQRP